MLHEHMADDRPGQRSNTDTERRDRRLPGGRRLTAVAAGLAIAALISVSGQNRLGEAVSGLSQMFSPGVLEQSRLAAVRPFLAGGRSEADWLSDADLDWRLQRAKLGDTTCAESGNAVPSRNFNQAVELELPRAL